LTIIEKIQKIFDDWIADRLIDCKFSSGNSLRYDYNKGMESAFIAAQRNLDRIIKEVLK